MSDGPSQIADRVGVDIDPTPFVLAPSEAVYLALQAELSDRDVLTAALKAALLASEHAGEISLSVTERPATQVGGQRHALMIVPAGKAANWPHASPESRLRVDESREVGEVVAEWLRQDSGDPWALGAEKVRIGLAIRGVATVGNPYSSRRTYVVSDPVRAQARMDAPPIMGLMQACKIERPQVSEMLDDAITDGIERRKSGGEQTGFSDPWDLEAEADRTRACGPVSYMPAWLAGVIGGCLAAVDGTVAWVSDQIVLTGIFAAFAISLLALASIPWPPLQTVLAQFGRRMNARARMGVPARPPTYGQRITGAVLMVPLVVLILLVLHKVLGWLFWPLALLGIFLGITWLLRRISGVLISDRVTQPPTVAPPAPRPDPLATMPSRAADRPPTAEPGAFSGSSELELQFISPDQVPPASPASSARLRLVDERPRRLRRIYGEAVLQLVAAYVLVVSVASAMLSIDRFPSAKIIAVWIAAALSLGLAGWVIRSSRPVAWQKWAVLGVIFVSSGKISLRDLFDRPREGETKEGAPEPGMLRAKGLFLAGAGWLALTLLSAPAYAQEAVSVTLLLSASAIAYVVVLRWRLARLEREYPLSPPFRLLALRVFGSPSLQDFMDLTSKWRWLGTTQRLDGPDTAGDRSGDVLAMLQGRLDTRVVANESELEQALAHFAEKPDNELRYPLNSIQCTDATWRTALDRLLIAADIIVMDLSGFTQERLGCKYELGKLIGAQVLDRVLLLVDETTDRALLESVLKQAWHAACEASPSRPMPRRVTVIQTGGVAGRGAGESEYEWRKRLAVRLDRDHFVALMVDKALADRNVDTPTDAAPRAVRWAKAASRGWVGMLAKATLVLMAVISLLWSIHNYRTRPANQDAAGISSAAERGCLIQVAEPLGRDAG